MYRSYQIARSLQMHLYHRGAKFQIAPYSAAAQLAYLERISYVAAIYGSASCLLHGADRVLLNFDWEKNVAVWVGLQRCLTKLDLNRDQFVDACLISGSTILPALPEFDTESPVPKIQTAKSMLKSVNNDVDSLLRHKPDDYHRLFYKARFALKHPVVLDKDGRVEPVDWRSGPSDAHEFIGQRLPEEIYFYMSRGLIGPRVLNWRTRMEVLETPPLDGGLSSIYKDLVQGRLRPLRTQVLALMTHVLNRYYQKNDVDLACWFDERGKTALNIPDQTEPTKAADTWHVKYGQKPSSNESVMNRLSLFYALSSLSKDSEAKKTITPRRSGSGPPLQDIQEVRLNTLWRFLQARGYVNSDHTLSLWGKALQAAFDRSRSSSNSSEAAMREETEEAILVAFELLRLDVLGTQQMFPMPPYTGAPLRGSETDKSNALLISRVACLGSLRHDPIGYTGPLSRNLLAYHQTAAAVRNALRDLLEMHACYILLSGAVNRAIEESQYTVLGAALPLMSEPDVGLGLVVKSYLDEISNKRIDVSQWFAHAQNIQGDLKKAWNIWDAVSPSVHDITYTPLETDEDCRSTQASKLRTVAS